MVLLSIGAHIVTQTQETQEHRLVTLTPTRIPRGWYPNIR